MAELKEGILVELGAKSAPFLGGMNLAKIGVASFVAAASVQLLKFNNAARETERVWERSMDEISTIAGATRSDIAGMREEIAKMSMTFGQEFEKVARARYDVISSGFAGISDSQKIMTASAKGAVGGLTDIAVAAKVTTAVLNAYAMDASKATMVNDMMFAAVRDGVIAYSELATQLGDVTSTAAAMNIPLSELLAMISTITLSGVSAPETITAVNQFLLAFVKQTEEAKKVSEEYGITLEDGLGPALAKIAALSKKDMEAVSELLPSVRAIKGALAGAAEDGQRFAEIQQRIINSAGSSEAANTTMAGGFDMLAKRVDASREALQATWGELAKPENQMWAELQLAVTSKLTALLREYIKLRDRAEADPSTYAYDMGGSMGAHGAIQRRPSASALVGGAPYYFPQLYQQQMRTEAMPGLGGPMTNDIQNMLYAFNEARIAAERKAVADAQGAEATADAAKKVVSIAQWLAAQQAEMESLAKKFEGGTGWNKYGSGHVSWRSGGWLGDNTDYLRGPAKVGGGYDLRTPDGGVPGRGSPIDDSRFSGMGSVAAAWEQRERQGREDDPFSRAERRLNTFQALADTMIQNTSGLIQDGIGGTLLEAFGGGESAVARFTASTLSQLAAIIWQATVMRSILSSIGLGGFAGALGFEGGGMVPGYSFGGYTGGTGGSRAVRGVVHGGEFVLNANATRRAGVHRLEQLNSGGGDTYNFGGININGTPTESGRKLANDIVGAIPGAMRTAARTGRIREAARTNRRT